MGHYSYTQPSDDEDLFGNNDDSDYSEMDDLIRRDQDELSLECRSQVHEFEEREEVATFSVNMPSPIVSTINCRTSVRNRQVHEHLKNDLIENIWVNLDILHITYNL